MIDDIRDIVAGVDAIGSVDSDEDLSRIQDFAERYFALPEAADYLDVWFRLYDRFPDDDGYGVFWTILHGIESQPNSGDAVVRSVRREPTPFPLLMVNRMLNAGIAEAGGVDLLRLLQEVADNERCSETVRQEAVRFLEHQRGAA